MSENFFDVGAIMDVVRVAVDKELKDCGEELLEEAKSLAPESTGRLKNSGYNIIPKGEFRPTVNVRTREIGFDTGKNDHSAGGKSFNYALYRHEVPAKNPTSGQTKYLETPYKANVASYNERVLNEGTKALKKATFGKIDI